MAALSAIIGQLDRMAKGRQAAMANYATGTDFWDRVDAAADETYENAVKGLDMTALDAELAAGAVTCNGFARWWTLHNSYAKGLGYADFGAYLVAQGVRVPYEANELAFESGYGRLTPASVFPKGTLVASEADPAASGMHLLGVYAGAALTSVTALPTTVGPVAVMAVNLGATATVGGTFTLTNWVAATTKDIALSYSTATQYTQQVLGEQALASGVSAGATALQVASTAAFTAGEKVLVWESDALQEVVTVDSLGTGPTRLVLTGGTVNAYTTSAVIWPLFRGVAYKSGASGSGTVNFYARPDRIIAL